MSQPALKPAESNPAKTATGVKHTCVFCGTNLPSKSELQDHFRGHANGSLDSRGKPATKKEPSNSKVKHFVSGTVKSKSVQSVSCDVCEAVFESVTLAIHHKYKLHPNCQKNYYCGFCGKQFPLEVCKEIHIRTEHKNDKKTNNLYRCRQCHIDFYSVQAVDAHVKNSHKRVANILVPTTTMPASKKIKHNNNGEPSSVYYCHLCGMEYMVKFNLQKHLEGHHTEEERNKKAEELVKCMLCEAMFYNKKAYTTHNFHHTPDDLYIDTEQQRKTAVTRVDCDFDLSRVPTAWEKFEQRKRPRVKRVVPLPESVDDQAMENGTLDERVSNPANTSATPSTTTSATSSSSSTSTTTENNFPNVGKNRAMVDSDDGKSDTSDESDSESTANTTNNGKKNVQRKKQKKA